MGINQTENIPSVDDLHGGVYLELAQNILDKKHDVYVRIFCVSRETINEAKTIINRTVCTQTTYIIEHSYKMKRGDLRPVALNKGVPNPACSRSNSSYGKERPVRDSSASKTTFQILAENCGFKVINEESKDPLDSHPEKNRYETTAIQENVSSRWQKDGNPVSKDVLVVSRVNNVVDIDMNEQKSTETYLVTRNGEDMAPKVDFLDMTDVSDTLENCLPKKCNTSGEMKSGREVGEQGSVTKESLMNSGNGHSHWPRYKIMKSKMGHTKGRSNDDRNRTSDGWKASSQIVEQSKSPHGAGKSKESQPQVFKLPSRRSKPRILLCDSSSPLSKDGKCAGEKVELENKGKDQSNRQASTGNAATSIQGTGSKHDNDGRNVESHQGVNQAFSNVNSSCLNQSGAQDIRVLPPKKNFAGGMMSYLRKMGSAAYNESRGGLKDSLSKPVSGLSRRFFNRQSNNNTSKSKISDRNNQTLLPTAKLKTKGTSRSQQQNVSPRTVNTTQGMSKFDSRTCGVDRESTNTRFPQLYRTYEVPMSSSVEKESQPTTFRLDKNRPQDYNINFNSEDGREEGVSFNSFIGYYLCELWKNQCLCDVRIKVGNTSFLAHKIVLAAFTDIFCPDDPHQIPTVSFDIPDVTEEAVSLILQYLYTSKMEVTDSVLEAVYTAASILEIGEITDLVLELLSKPTVQNFEKYLTIRQRIGLPHNILEVYNDFVLENLLEIEDSPYILGMQLADMEKLLRDPNVKINCEADIFRVIIKWLKYNPCHRTRHASELLTLVDFDCIGPETLSSIVEQNRHLFDLPSMDIIMGAFKKFALRCKDAPPKDPPCYTDPSKSGKAKCFCSKVQSISKDNTGNYSEEEPYEGHNAWYPEPPSPDTDRFGPPIEARSRKLCAMSPQDIRRSARHFCTGQTQMDSTAIKGCSQNDTTKRCSKSGRCNSSNLQPEIQYTIRQKKRLCDSSNNFPSELCDLRSRSSSSESRRGHFYRCLNQSRSDTDAGQVTPVCDCCCIQEGHVGRKRPTYTCSGNAGYDPDKMNDREEPQCCSNYLTGQRQCQDSRKTSRRFSCNQVCQRSRSSSLSSGSSLRYNGSSSGSSKRVTFS